MKVLFVSREKQDGKASIVVDNQLISLQKKGIAIDQFLIRGKGINAYLTSICRYLSTVTKIKYDIIHAHYSYSGFFSVFALKNRVVVSLMGSDVRNNIFSNILIRTFYRFFWKSTIVKSKEMKERIGIKNVSIIPNGVDTEKFFPQNKISSQKYLGWEMGKTHILFPAKPSRPEKNFSFAEKIVESLGKNFILHYLMDVPPEEISLWMNAADVILLTSLWEGSPNVIKEAMACNRPVVCTDVGDVRFLFGNEPGHFIISDNISEASKKLEEAIRYSQEFEHTEGRNRIKNLGLDAESIASKLIEVYSQV